MYEPQGSEKSTYNNNPTNKKDAQQFPHTIQQFRPLEEASSSVARIVDHPDLWHLATIS